MLEFFKSLFRYLTYGIWHEDLESITRKKFVGIKALRVLLLIGDGFTKDQCALHASALTFISLVSFIPVLTICFIFANFMGISELLHQETKQFVSKIAEAPIPLEEKIFMLGNSNGQSGETNNIVPLEISVINLCPNLEAEIPATEIELPLEVEQPKQDLENQILFSTNSCINVEYPESYENGVVTVDTLNGLIDFIFEKINGINYKALGLVGIIFFAWSVFGLLEKIELAFNSVWKQKQQRPILIKLRDYSVILFVVPALAILAFLISLLNVLINHISKFDGGTFAALVDNPISRFIMIASLLMLAFSVINKAIPNVPVRFKPALVGGIFTTIAFIFWMKICLLLQIGVARYSAAFGSFAVVPIILFWVYISWQIILFGAEVTYAFQNWKEYKPDLLTEEEK